MLKRMLIQVFSALWLFGSAALTQAHHSSAGVDTDKTLSVSGTLKDFDFSAPHAQIAIESVDANGVVVETKVSTIAPAGLINQGFKPKDFASGQKVEMTYHPNRNQVGGIMVTLKLQDGRVVKGNVY